MACSCNHDKNIFLPKEAIILKATQMTASETHFVLKMDDNSEFN